MNATAVTDVLYNVNSIFSRPLLHFRFPSASVFRAFLIFYIPPHPASSIFIVFIYQKKRRISRLPRNFEVGGYSSALTK